MGLMGAGKTSVASGLAARWGRPLLDSDADLQVAHGVTANELALAIGADGLHALEGAHLLDALRRRPVGVVAAAASTVDRADCRRALVDDAVVVWLDGPPGVLAGRQAVGGHRPQYADDVVGMLRDMDARRRGHFEEVADVVVRLPDEPTPGDVDARAAAITQLVDEVEMAIRALPGGQP